METYLVGGAVRDQLLGLPVRERDWVVVGATPEAMLALGYTPVGRDFPVFLHPETHDEYALARTERKTGHGYTGFATNSDPGITPAPIAAVVPGYLAGRHARGDYQGFRRRSRRD